MDTTKQINIKNRTYYFYNDIIDIENFDAKLLKIDKKSYKDIDIFNFGYITKKKFSNCKNINRVNPLFFVFFLSGFSFTNIHVSRDSRGRGRVSI